MPASASSQFNGWETYPSSRPLKSRLTGGYQVKKIECVIRPGKLGDLEQALRHVGVGGMTVAEVKGFGNEQTRPCEYLFLPKTKVEIFCADEQVEDIVRTISETCRSGKLGDGKIVIYPIEDIIRIRTFERGEAAV